MVTRLACAYLQGEVELTAEREEHILERHPDLLRDHAAAVAETLADPDQVARSVRFQNVRLLSRWYTGLRGGKYAVVVVVSDPPPSARHRIVTAYLSRRVARGIVEWVRS